MQEEKFLGVKRRKGILIGFAAFLLAMWLCTVISRSIYASKLPMVTVENPSQKYVEHLVEADGIVEAGSKNAVTALSGLRVEKLMVQEGDKVEEGDLLFTVDMEDLNQQISKRQAEISKVQLQINAILQNKQLAEQKKAIEEQRAREDYDTTARYQDTLVGRAQEEVARAEEDLEDAGNEEVDEEIAGELKDALKSAAYAEADARGARDSAMKEARRAIEDLLFPENEDATLDSYRLELSNMQKELSFFQTITDEEGMVTAKTGGFITDIYVSAGGRIPDTAVMLISDDSVPCQFKVNLTSEEKKYVSLHDNIQIKLEGSSKTIEAKIDYLAENEFAPGSFEAHVILSEGVGTPGIAGTLSCKKQGEKYSCCISPIALYKMENACYVYVMREREGILGAEYFAEKVQVRILDENDYYVAVEGAIDSSSNIIVSATKEIGQGDTVRIY